MVGLGLGVREKVVCGFGWCITWDMMGISG